jgi:hypothetical protein
MQFQVVMGLVVVLFHRSVFMRTVHAFHLTSGLLFIRGSRLDYVQHSLGDQLIPDWRDMGCINPN